jgi:hypothetical protein
MLKDEIEEKKTKKKTKKLQIIIKRMRTKFDIRAKLTK